MVSSIEYLLLIGSSLILVSIAIAKFSANLGVPTLVNKDSLPVVRAILSKQE